MAISRVGGASGARIGWRGELPTDLEERVPILECDARLSCGRS